MFSKIEKKLLEKATQICIVCPNCQRIPLLSVNRNKPYLLHIECSCSYNYTQSIRHFLFEQLQLFFDKKNHQCYNNDNENKKTYLCFHCNQWFCLKCIKLHVTEKNKCDILSCPLWHQEVGKTFFCNNCQIELCEDCGKYHFEQLHHFIIDNEAIAQPYCSISNKLYLIEQKLKLYRHYPHKTYSFYANYLMNLNFYYLSTLINNIAEKNDKSWNTKLNSKRFGGQLNSHYIMDENEYMAERFKNIFVLDFLSNAKDKVENYKSVKYCNNSITHLLLLNDKEFIASSLDNNIYMINLESMQIQLTIQKAHELPVLYLCKFDNNTFASLTGMEIKIWKKAKSSIELLSQISGLINTFIMTTLTNNRFAYNSDTSIVLRSALNPFNIIKTIYTIIIEDRIYSILQPSCQELLVVSHMRGLCFIELASYKVVKNFEHIICKSQNGLYELSNNKLLVISIKCGKMYILNTIFLQEETIFELMSIENLPIYNKIDHKNKSNKYLIIKGIYYSDCIRLNNNKLMLITNSNGIMIFDTISYKCQAQFIEFSLFYMYSLIKLSDNKFAMTNDDNGAITYFDYIPNK